MINAEWPRITSNQISWPTSSSHLSARGGYNIKHPLSSKQQCIRLRYGLGIASRTKFLAKITMYYIVTFVQTHINISENIGSHIENLEQLLSILSSSLFNLT